ncbi:MAG: hypothetical protein ACRDUY_13455, partial [Nitriliruptorales bacterium]
SPRCRRDLRPRRDRDQRERRPGGDEPVEDPLRDVAGREARSSELPRELDLGNALQGDASVTSAPNRSPCFTAWKPSSTTRDRSRRADTNRWTRSLMCDVRSSVAT